VEIDLSAAVKINLEHGAIFAIARALIVRKDDIGRVGGAMLACGN